MQDDVEGFDAVVVGGGVEEGEGCGGRVFFLGELEAGGGVVFGEEGAED